MAAVQNREKWIWVGSGAGRSKEAAASLADRLLLPPRAACRRGTWREETFKAYNFDALGLLPAGGHLHPLMKVRGCLVVGEGAPCAAAVAGGRCGAVRLCGAAQPSPTP